MNRPTQTEHTVVELYNANKSVYEINQITGLRIPDIEAILKKWYTKPTKEMN